MVATTGFAVVFLAVKTAILPVPIAAKPIDVVLFDHEYVVVPPLLLVVKLTAVVEVLLHNI